MNAGPQREERQAGPDLHRAGRTSASVPPAPRPSRCPPASGAASAGAGLQARPPRCFHLFPLGPAWPRSRPNRPPNVCRPRQGALTPRAAAPDRQPLPRAQLGAAAAISKSRSSRVALAPAAAILAPSHQSTGQSEPSAAEHSGRSGPIPPAHAPAPAPRVCALAPAPYGA